VARSLVALHATGAAAVYLASWARMGEVGVADVDRALFDDRTVVRVLGMRRTVFVVPVEVMPIVYGACTRAIAARERRNLERMLVGGGICRSGSEEAWLRSAEADTLRALEARGEATAAELASDVPQLRERLHFGEGRRWAGSQGMSTRVLWVLAGEGQVVRGRPRGTWTSSQYRWAPFDRWLGGAVPELPVEDVQAELARRWLRTFGPGTAADLRWWAGWTARDTARALAAVGAVEVELDGGGTGQALPDDLDPVGPPEPHAALLPPLDSTVMGWKEREWFLGRHAPALFDRAGNAGPTVWWDGRIVGGWGQRTGGQVAYRLLEDVGREADRAIESEAARLEEWLGGARVPPSFRTPLVAPANNTGGCRPIRARSTAAGSARTSGTRGRCGRRRPAPR
jgi:hypothetical protein